MLILPLLLCDIGFMLLFRFQDAGVSTIRNVDVRGIVSNTQQRGKGERADDGEVSFQTRSEGGRGRGQTMERYPFKHAVTGEGGGEGRRWRGLLLRRHRDERLSRTQVRP
jgi:hypothetical protein